MPAQNAFIHVFVNVFNKTTIPLALVGYDIVIANAHSWNNCQIFQRSVMQIMIVAAVFEPLNLIIFDTKFDSTSIYQIQSPDYNTTIIFELFRSSSR